VGSSAILFQQEEAGREEGRGREGVLSLVLSFQGEIIEADSMI